MQTDVLSGHIDTSGFIVPNGRVRVKSIVFQGSGSGAGSVDVFDTTTAPISATYGRSGTTITVTKSSHGLSTGNVVGIEFQAAGGASGTNGNYVITVTGANTFTKNHILVSINEYFLHTVDRIWNGRIAICKRSMTSSKHIINCVCRLN